MSNNQLSFSTLFDGHASDTEAKAARDKAYREAKALGFRAKRWVLKNQLRQYASFGVPDGRSCDVYMLDVWED